MLDETLGSNITDMIFWGITDTINPSQRLHGCLSFAEINCFLDSIDSFFSSQSYFPLSFQKHAIKLFTHFLEIFDQVLWIFSAFIMKFEYLFVNIWDTFTRQIIHLFYFTNLKKLF